MNTIIKINNKNISIELELHVVRISNDDELQSLLILDIEITTTQLITNIRTTYFQLFGKDFEVSDASIAVEIWGHVYTDKFAEAVKSFSSIQLVDELAEKIVHHCEIIDIGESGHDENRFVWDTLAPFKSAIAKLLPKS